MLRDPASVDAGALVRPSALDLAFEGFHAEAFAVLDRLKARPYLAQYQAEKPAVQAHLMAPFKRYRDDLVVNFVLPNHLAWETERGVFSRLLKNDFGAGGSHHHLWMAFYRPGLRRLTDLQLSHSIDPEGFTVGLYVGDYARGLLRQARARTVGARRSFEKIVGPLLEDEHRFACYVKGQVWPATNPAALAALPSEVLARADGLWVGRTIPRAAVLHWGAALVGHALDVLMALWPLYTFWGQADPDPNLVNP